jgi:adenylate cyclase
MPELIASGLDPSQRWQRALAEGETVRIGRAPRHGWHTSWDKKISREHADLLLKDGELTVRCLGTGQNPIYYEGQPTRHRIKLALGETFRIGDTQFRFVDGSVDEDVVNPLHEFSYSHTELADIEFGNDRERLKALSRLSARVANCKTEEDFATVLCDLLIETIPRGNAAAVLNYEESSQITTGQPSIVRWCSRDDLLSEFCPSSRLVRSTLLSGMSHLYVWPETITDDKHLCTIGDGFDWAFCTPIGAEQQKLSCLYVTGHWPPGGVTFVLENEVKGDLHYAKLLAESITSARELNRLQDHQIEMSHFFSPAVVEPISDVMSRSGSLMPTEQDISVLFCDMRGFSRVTEKSRHNLHELLERISSALGLMTKAIMRHEGVVADFQGDSVFAFWGWPTQLESGPTAACQAALLIHREFQRASQDEAGSLTGFQVGIGIGHGNAIAGKIGSEEQCKIGVFGPVVNLASRLEGMTKKFRVSILIDAATARFVRKHFQPSEARVRKLGAVRPQGIKTPLMVSELLPPEGQQGAISNDLILQHEQAVDDFIAGNWSDAFDVLDQTPVSNRAKEIILLFMAHNNYTPPPDWDGIIDLESK